MIADPDDFTAANDKQSWWYADANDDGIYDNVQFITDGKSEPLSGTFNAILDH